MKDQSIPSQSSQQDKTYINECIKEVSINGDSISKYKRMIEKRYGEDCYEKCKNFIQVVRRSVNRQKFTSTSVSDLKYLADEIFLSSVTIDTIVNTLSESFCSEKNVNNPSSEDTRIIDYNKQIEAEEAARRRAENAENKRKDKERREQEEAERKATRKNMGFCLLLLA